MDQRTETQTLPIEHLDLPARVYRCLKASGIHMVEQVLQTTPADLLKIRNFGRHSLQLLKARLKKKGIPFNPSEKAMSRTEDLTVLLGMPIEQIGFPDALVERLHLAQIERLGELVTLRPAQIMKYPTLGPRSVQMIRRLLNDLGLDLGMDFVAADATGEKWMDRLAVSRVSLAGDLKGPSEMYFFSKEYGIALKTLKRFLKNLPLSVYESSKLRTLFSKTIAPFDMRGSVSYKRMMGVEEAYRKSGSLQTAARKTGLSHEQVRQLLKLGDALGLFSYRPRRPS